ncbi:hypothetical protein HGA91_00790 [candidate division WWE3 bacterium]|nr:hypothetical protein [candidate division WWE3 bacterium]
MIKKSIFLLLALIIYFLFLGGFALLGYGISLFFTSMSLNGTVPQLFFEKLVLFDRITWSVLCAPISFLFSYPLNGFIGHKLDQRDWDLGSYSNSLLTIIALPLIPLLVVMLLRLI